MIDLLGLPLTSILLFVLAGVLVGYLLWYPDRAQHKEQVEGLEQRYWRARRTVRERKSRFRELQKTSQSQQTEIDRLSHERDDQFGKYRDSDNQLAETRRELATLRESNRQTELSLTSESRRSESLVQQLQEVLETNAEGEQEQERQRSTIEELNQRVESIEQQLERTTSEYEAQSQSIVEQKQKIEQLTTQAETTADEVRAEFQSQLDQKSEVLDRTEKDLIDRCADLDQVRDERDDLKQQVEQLQTRSRYVESEMKRLEEVARQRDEMASDLHSAADSLGQQRELLEAREVDLELRNEELSHLRGELKAATELLDQNAETQRQLIASIDERDLKMVAFDERTEQLASANQEITTLNSKLETKDEAIAILRSRLTATEQRLGEISETHEQTLAALATSANQTIQAQTESTQLQADCETMQTEIDELRVRAQTVETLESSIQTMREDQQSASQRVSDLERELAEKRQSIERQQSDMRKLAEEIDVLEPLREELATATASLMKHQTRVASLERDSTNQQAEIETLRQQAELVPVLQDDLKQTVTKLEFSREETAGAISRIGELNRQLDNVRVHHNELQSSESSLRHELDTRIDELQNIIRDHRELQVHHQEVSERCERLAQIAVQYEELRDAQSTLKMELNQKSAELDEVCLSKEQLLHRHQELSDRCGDLEKIRVQFATLQVSQSTLMNELEEKAEELQGIAQDRDHLRLEHQQLRERCDQLEQISADYDALKESETGLKAELESRRQSLESVTQSYERLKSQHQDLANRFRQVEQDAQIAEKDWTKRRDIANETIEKQATELATLRSTIHDQERSLKAVYLDLSERCGLHESAVTEVGQWQQRVQEEMNRQEVIEQRNQELQGRIASLTDHLERLRTELEDSLDANERAHAQIRDLRRRRAA